jgi:hypothetical protein
MPPSGLEAIAERVDIGSLKVFLKGIQSMLMPASLATLFHFQFISTPVMAPNIFALMIGEKTRRPSRSLPSNALIGAENNKQARVNSFAKKQLTPARYRSRERSRRPSGACPSMF